MNSLCPEHNCPIIELADGTQACVVEHISEHLGAKRIVDFISDPARLVFEDGHTLPLQCAHCGKPIHFEADQEDALLEQLTMLYLVGVQYLSPPDAEYESVLLVLAQDSHTDPTDPTAELQSIFIHMDSVRELTCPQIEMGSDAETD